ncbi:MAG: DUF1786 family protein [Candidatus Heimdallarchaeaceae archaeon]
MKILAIDIGAGTQDVFLYDSSKSSLENSIKLVLPSPAQIFAQKVRQVTDSAQDLIIHGEIIGGGAFTSAIKNHLKKSFNVYITELAALTIRNKLEEVRDLGINIIHDSEINDFDGVKLCIHEVFLEEIFSFLESFGESQEDIDVVAVAVQDHGKAPEGISDRKYRIHLIKELLQEEPRAWKLAFTKDEVNEVFLRMHSAIREIEHFSLTTLPLVMDTSSAAILGAMTDPFVTNKQNIIAMDVGNAHTMAAVVMNGEIHSLMEHHTHKLTPTKLANLLKKLVEGELTNDEVFKDGGHGVIHLKEPLKWQNIELVAVTGPQRKMVEKIDMLTYYAAPSGDMMMTGPMGLIEAAKYKFKEKFVL